METANFEARTFTAKEYLEREILADTRNEFHAGTIVPKPGGTPAHNHITGNLYIQLRLALKKLAYGIFAVNQRLWILEREFYTYPDVMVVGKPLAFQDGRKDTLTNACAIAEVLSESSRSYDMSDKFTASRSLETLQDYLLIDQYRVNVEHRVRRSENEWLITYYDRLNATFQLESCGVTIALADLYEDTEFESREIESISEDSTT